MTSTDAAMERDWELDGPPPLFAGYNVTPGTEVPVVRRSAAGGREALLMRWGLIPAWAKGEPPRYSTINATCERIATAASYRGPWRAARRCLVPVRGFYEWQTVPGQSRKQPWFIRLPGGPLFALGGLWERSRRDDGSWVESCTIVTLPANALLAEIHNSKQRMPLILPPEDYAGWLSAAPESAEALIRPYPAAAMEAWPVGPHVNNPKNDDPRCCSPVAAP